MPDKQTKPTGEYQECNFKFPGAKKRTLQPYLNFLKSARHSNFNNK